MPSKDRKTASKRAERAAVDRQKQQRRKSGDRSTRASACAGARKGSVEITEAYAAITMRRLFTGAAKKFFMDSCPGLEDIASIEIPYKLALTNSIAVMALAKEFMRQYPMPKNGDLGEVAKWTEALNRFWSGCNRFLKTAGDLQKQHHNQQLASMPNSVEIKITRDDGTPEDADPWTVSDDDSGEYEYDPEKPSTGQQPTLLKH